MPFELISTSHCCQSCLVLDGNEASSNEDDEEKEVEEVQESEDADDPYNMAGYDDEEGEAG